MNRTVTGAGAVSSAIPVTAQPMPTSPNDSVFNCSNSEFDCSDSDENTVVNRDRLKTPSKKRSSRKALTPTSAKRSRSIGKHISSEMERMNNTAEAETEILKQFLAMNQKESEPDYLKSALEIVQGDTFLQEIGVHNLISAIKRLRSATEAKVFVLLKPEHRTKFIQSLLDEA